MQQIIDLEEKDQIALQKLNDKQAAIQSFVAMAQQNAEQKMQECQADGRKLWSSLAEKYDLDLSTHAYTMSADGKKLVLTQVRYGQP